MHKNEGNAVKINLENLKQELFKKDIIKEIKTSRHQPLAPKFFEQSNPENSRRSNRNDYKSITAN